MYSKEIIKYVSGSVGTNNKSVPYLSLRYSMSC